MHTLWTQLLLELSLDLFSILQICYRHTEDMHEEVWCSNNTLWQNDRVFSLAIFRRLNLVNYSWLCILCEINSSLRAFTANFSTLCRYITDILKMCMKKFDAEKIFFDKLNRVFKLAKIVVYSAYFVKSTPLRAFIGGDMLQAYWRCAWRILMLIFFLDKMTVF